MNADPPTLPPPHPDPHPPRLFTPPPGSCDAHCHLFGPADRFPYAKARPYTPADAGLEAYRLLQARLGLTRAVFVQPACHGHDHAALLDALKRGQGRHAGVALLDPAIKDEDLEALHVAGVRGARFNFLSHLGGSPDPATFERIIARIAPLGWHVVLHVDGPTLANQASAFRDLGCDFVIDHLGRIDLADGLDQPAVQALLGAADDPRGWIKLSAADRISAEPGGYADVLPLMRLLVERAPERLLWGSDWPHPNVRHMPDDGDMLDLLALAAPDAAVRDAILVDNPARLYDFH